MPQDIEKKHQFEQIKQEHKEARAEARADDETNAAVLQADNHTGQQGLLPTDQDHPEAVGNKDVYALLPGWPKDELRRLHLVPRGERLKPGGKYFDLRSPDRGELTAHGEEEVHEELLVAKNDVDYELWDKLLGRTERLSSNTP